MKRERRTYIPKLTTYRRADGDHAWRVTSRKEIIADSSEGYRNRADMRDAIWIALEGLLRWCMNRDKVRALKLVSVVTGESNDVEN